MGLNAGYTETRFQSETPPGGAWPSSFAVISAYNPMGSLADDAQNLARDAELAENLSASGMPFWRVTGGNLSYTHAEPGYAVATTLERGVALGRAFQQEAIFWVEDDQLFLVECADPQLDFVCSWSERQDGWGAAFIGPRAAGSVASAEP